MWFGVMEKEHERVQIIGTLLTSRRLFVRVSDVLGVSHEVPYDQYEEAVDKGDIRIVTACKRCGQNVVHPTREDFMFGSKLCGLCTRVHESRSGNG